MEVFLWKEKLKLYNMGRQNEFVYNEICVCVKKGGEIVGAIDVNQMLLEKTLVKFRNRK